MKLVNKVVEIYIEDLKEDIQKELLEILGIKNPEDANYDIFPLTVVPVPED